MDSEARELLKNEIVEQLFLKLPEIIGNLMSSQASLNKLNKKFYSENPEFRNNKDLVVNVIEEIEGKNPGKDYESIVKIATPIIKQRMEIVNKLNTNNISRPAQGVAYNGEL